MPRPASGCVAGLALVTVLAGCGQTAVNQDTRRWLDEACAIMLDVDAVLADGLPPQSGDPARDERAIVGVYGDIVEAYGYGITELGRLRPAPRADAGLLRDAVVAEYRAKRDAFAEGRRAAERFYVTETGRFNRELDRMGGRVDAATRRRHETVERIDDAGDLDRTRRWADNCADLGI